MVSVSSALMTKAANKHLHAERRHTLSVMMQTLLPSGEAQAVMQPRLVELAAIENILITVQNDDCIVRN
jgi:hypothetical protein